MGEETRAGKTGPSLTPAQTSRVPQPPEPGRPGMAWEVRGLSAASEWSRIGLPLVSSNLVQSRFCRRFAMRRTVSRGSATSAGSLW